MSSTSNKRRTISVSLLLNLCLFPANALSSALSATIPCIFLYFALQPLIPPERLVEARHIAVINTYVVICAVAFSFASNLTVAIIIHRMVTRPLTALARWAERRYANGVETALVLVSRITEIRELGDIIVLLFDEQMRRVKELRTLIGSTRHDISNRLSDIFSIAQFLRDDPDFDRRKAATTTIEAVSTVNHILKVNAEITKNYCNIRGAEPTDVRPYDIVNDCLDQLEPEAARAGLRLDSDIPPSSLVVVAHPALLESIIRNLVGNAIKYTPAGGSIRLSVRQSEDPNQSKRQTRQPKVGVGQSGLIHQLHASSPLEITVADSGIGITDADKPHVFEREFRSQAVRGIPGTGYGLADVHSVVTFYNGSITISDNKPAGTIFTVRLPLPPRQALKPNPQSPLTSILSRHSALYARLFALLKLIFPMSNHWAVYATLVSVPASVYFAAILFYEWFSDTPKVADVTFVSSYYLGGYALASISVKIVLLFCYKRIIFAFTRIGITVVTLFINVAIICSYVLFHDRIPCP